MKTNYFTISGVIGPKEYFKTLAIILTEFIVVTSILFYLLDMQNAELLGAPAANQVASIVFLVLILLNLIVVYVALFSAIIRRARDAGSVVLWTGLSLMVPMLFIVLGFVPKYKK